MMRFIIFILFYLSLCTYSVGQRISEVDSIGLMCKVDTWNNDWRIKNYSWKVNDYRLKATKLYSESSNKDLIIQNSFPKGGGYMDVNGQNFGYSIFWTRIINETDAPIELTISFNSFTIFPSPDSFLKLFLPQDTMTFAKTVSYDYGVDLESFLDNNFHSPTMLKKTISPNEEYFFNIGALSNQGNGVARAELVLKGEDLFYRILGPQLEPALIPCGSIRLKK
jgi:hypothetical protein